MSEASPAQRGASRRRGTRPTRSARPTAVRRTARVLAALCLTAALACVGGCTDGSDGPQRYVSPYTWENLDRTDGRYTYYEDGAPASMLGVDVSDHQGFIDWSAVAADGIEFAIVRIGYRGTTEGGLYADGYADANMDGAAASGLAVGVYFFSQAVTPDEAVEEAEFALSLLAGRELALPVVYDHEPVAGSGRANDIDDETASACARAFCERIEEAGYATMIYGNSADMSRYDESVTDARPVWFAEYNTPTPTAQFDLSIWQYSNAGTVDGIATNVDMNILFLTAPDPVAPRR